MKIGILGGIGPESTGILYMKIIEKLQKNKLIRDNRDYPQILINSIPAPELIFEKIKPEDLNEYKKGLEELDKHNLDFIIMACNTIHLFLEELQKGIKTKIISIKEIVKQELYRKGIKNLVVIGTPSTISKGLYYFKDISYMEITKIERNIISRSVFEYNHGNKKEAYKVENIVTKYLNKGAESILLGCTELALMLKDKPFPKIDTIDLLANKIIEIKKKKN